MGFFTKCGSLALLGMVMAGCVSQRHADHLQTLNRRAHEQILELQARLEDKQAQIEALQANAQDPDLPHRLAAAIAEQQRLEQALASAEDQLRTIGSTPVLEPELDSALFELSRTNPSLMTYDPQQGMVKFQSDLTFALGSANVNPAAMSSLQRLAQILGSQVAAKYEVRVVGHTDNVPVNRPATRAKHPTNWHLSVHRAISVKDALVKSGVAAGRIGVAGYGEYRPIAANARKGGNQANRRVEIYLVRSPYAGMDNSRPAAIPQLAPIEKPVETTAQSAPPTAVEPAVAHPDPQAQSATADEDRDVYK